MDKEEMMVLINEAIIKERWRIANRIEGFHIDVNILPSNNWQPEFAIDNWEGSCINLANQIRGIGFNLAFWYNGATDDGKVSFTCTKCSYKKTQKPFECNILTLKNFKDIDGVLMPVCPKCGNWK